MDGFIAPNSPLLHRFPPSLSLRSFYDALFPPGSVDLSYSCTAIHWLSAAPGPKQNYSYFQSPLETKETKEAWDKQSRADLDRFYALRAREGWGIVIIRVQECEFDAWSVLLGH